MGKPAKKRMGRPPKRPHDRLVDFALRIEKALADDISTIAGELGLDRSKAARYLLSSAVTAYRTQKSRPSSRARAA